MRFLSTRESLDWIARHAKVSVVNGQPSVGAATHTGLRVPLPQQIGPCIAFCRALWMSFLHEQPVLLWVVQRGVWPSGEHIPLALAVRQALGATGDLDEQPAAVVEVEDGENGISLLLLSALFGWDCWLVTEAGPVLFVSHDEFVEVYTPLGGDAAANPLFEHFELVTTSLVADGSCSRFLPPTRMPAS